MSPKDYIVPATNDVTSDSCFIAITSLDMDIIVLGDSFMRGFYTIFSDSHQMVGIAPHSNSNKIAPVYEPVVPHRMLDSSNFINLTEKEIIEIVSGLFSLYILGYLLYECFQRHFRKDEDDSDKVVDDDIQEQEEAKDDAATKLIVLLDKL